MTNSISGTKPMFSLHRISPESPCRSSSIWLSRTTIMASTWLYLNPWSTPPWQCSRLPSCKTGHVPVAFLPGCAGGPITAAPWSGCCVEYWASERRCPRAHTTDMSPPPAAISQTFTIFFCVKRPHHLPAYPQTDDCDCVVCQECSGQRNSQAQHHPSQSKHPRAQLLPLRLPQGTTAKK